MRSELVGRDAELRAVDAAVARAAGGGPAALALLGRAGLGKSTLLAELEARAAAAGMLVLAGRAAEHERDVPFGVVVDALDDQVAGLHPRRLESLGADREADLAAVLPSVARHVPAVAAVTAQERVRLHRALAALLELLAGERPVALLLDDVHWADPATVELLLHLLRRSSGAPVLLAFALRPVEPAPRLLDALRRAPHASWVEVAPLDDDAAGALLARSGLDAAAGARLVEEAQGNPLYLQELARVAGTPGAPLPVTLLAAVQQELAMLTPAARLLLEGAAVAGDPFDADLAAAAAGTVRPRRDERTGSDPVVASVRERTDRAPLADVAALDELVAADLVRPLGEGARFAFRHPLVRRAVHEATPPGWRIAAHRRTAAALAGRGAPAVARAYHVEQYAAPGDDEAAAVLAEAGAASDAVAPETAARWYAAALRLVPGAAREQCALLTAAMAQALGAQGRVDEAHAALLDALALLPDEPTPFRTMVVAGCAALDQLLGRHAEAARRVERALAALPDDAGAAQRAALELQLASAMAFTQDRAGLRRHAGRATATLGDDAAPAVLCGDQALLALAGIWNDEPELRDAALARARAAWARCTDDDLAAQPEVPVLLAWTELLGEHFDQATAVLGRGLDVLRASRQGRTLTMLHLIYAMALTNGADFRRALEHLELAEPALEGLAFQQEFSLWLGAVIRDGRGEALEVRRLVEAYHAYPRSSDERFTAVALANLAALQVDEDPARCIEEAVAVGGRDMERVDPTWSTWMLLILVRAAVQLGRLEDAEHWARVCAARAEGIDLPAGRARALAARAEIDLARGDAAAAVAQLRDSVARSRAHGARADALRTQLVLARALAADGDRDAAVALLRATADEAPAGHMLRVRDTAARDLRALGVRTGAPAASTGEVLTPRERQIAELVVAGCSNKEVAAKLFLSEKTVEHHLSRVYAKAGVRSRGELARVGVGELASAAA